MRRDRARVGIAAIMLAAGPMQTLAFSVLGAYPLPRGSVRAAPVAATQRCVPWRRADVSADVRMCDGAETPPLIDGVPAAVGDPVLCRDPASDAWWRATVIATSDARVRVHYGGCDDSWDEWFDASSPNLMRVDQAEAARPAFQSEEYEESLSDDELLDSYREKRWADNARWQLHTFAQSQLGTWRGARTVYVPVAEEGAIGMRAAGEPTACSLEAAVADGGVVSWREGAEGGGPTREIELNDGCFARERGSMAVGAAYTLNMSGGPGASDEQSDDVLLLELGIREGDARVRARFAYAREQPAATDGADVLAISRVEIVREGASGAAAPSAAGTPAGAGLYDPPPYERAAYVSLYLEGGLTLVFPARLDVESAGFVAVDWSATDMRYQVRGWHTDPSRHAAHEPPSMRVKSLATSAAGGA